MQINTLKVHSNYNLLRVLVLSTLCFFFLNPTLSKSFKIAIIDTSFCPSLIKTGENIVIEPVVDLTQSHSFKCYQATLNKRAFHGHWVLDTIVSGLNPKEKVVITPLIVFNRRGEQKFNYWDRAFKFIKEKNIDLTIAAAGMPLIEKADQKKATSMGSPEIPILLAVGRKGPFIREEVSLFPHIHNTWQMTFFGSYHEGLDSDSFDREDKQQFIANEIDYYFPFESYNNQYPQLKGSSLALALGARIVLKSCLAKIDQTNRPLMQKSLRACLKELRIPLKMKDKTAYTLKSGPIAGQSSPID